MRVEGWKWMLIDEEKRKAKQGLALEERNAVALRRYLCLAVAFTRIYL